MNSLAAMTPQTYYDYLLGVKDQTMYSVVTYHILQLLSILSVLAEYFIFPFPAHKDRRRPSSLISHLLSTRKY